MDPDDIKELFKQEASRTGERSGLPILQMEYQYSGTWELD